MLMDWITCGKMSILDNILGNPKVSIYTHFEDYTHTYYNNWFWSYRIDGRKIILFEVEGWK
jgi:hypothetical protein